MAKDFIGIQGVTQTAARTFDFADESGIGADDGTPIQADMIMQLHAVAQKLMIDKGDNFNGLQENATSQTAGDQQIFDALVTKIDTRVQNAATQNAEEDKIAKFIGRSLRISTIADGAINDTIYDAVNKGYANQFVTPIGSIIPFGSATVPTGWFECNGAAVSRTTYPLLFAAIGTTWGAGDGSTTFRLPDLRHRALAGAQSGLDQGDVTNQMLLPSGTTAPISTDVGDYLASGTGGRRYAAITKFIIRAL